MSGLILLLTCILFSAGASLFLKLGAASISGRIDALSLVQNPLIWVGGFLYGFAFLGYIYVLRLIPLSLAQPVITAGVSLITAFIAVVFFREQILPLNWIGLLLICVGIFFLFTGRSG
jgi:multidrug transporter EmrE-like cation transporter